MTLKSTFKLALVSLLLNSSGVLAADNSAVLGQWDLTLNLQGNEIPVNLTITEDVLTILQAPARFFNNLLSCWKKL